MTVSNYLSFVIFGLCCGVPLILLIIGFCYRSKWQDDSFGLKYGAFLDGTSPDASVTAVLFIASIFYFRRMIMCVTLVFWQEFFWGQIAL